MGNIDITILLKIIIFSTLLALTYNFVSPAGISLTGEVTEKRENATPIVDEIDEKEAYKIYAEDKALFIDARDSWEYGESHIKGAINIPEYKTDIEDLKEENIPSAETYIIYCASSDCGTSKKLAEKMLKAGFNNIAVFKGGWQEWLDSGYPVEAQNE